MKISVCLIVKNEERVLARALRSVQEFADEIIVVDTGSSDKTKSIAFEFTPHVYDFEWSNDFSLARNYAFERATLPYVMWLDADDYIAPADVGKILALKTTTDPADMYFMRYATAFDEAGNPTFCFMRERLVRNTPRYRFSDPVHECIIPSGRVVYTDITVQHRKLTAGDPQRNLKIYQNLLRQNRTFSPRMLFYYANELFYNRKFRKAVGVYNKFLKIEGAFVENKIQACLNRAKCYAEMNLPESAEQSLYQSFCYATPRSEVLCELSLQLINAHRYRTALFWLELAVQPADLSGGAFILPDCHEFIPYYNMAVCYYNLKDYQNAKLFAQKASRLKPSSKPAQMLNDFLSKL